MSLRHQFKYPLNAPERTLEHKEIIRKKTFLRKLYKEWYAQFSKEIEKHPEGIYVELGSGGGFLKDIEPSVICSDVLKLPTNDLNFSAHKMPFDDDSLNGIFMVDTFHHIPECELFLSESSRVLKKGAKIIMIEPANSIWGRFIYKNFHHEPFNPAGNWKIPDDGPLSGANGALPWIVFERDQKLFSQKFPELLIDSVKYHTPLRYLVSGGVSIKQLVPDFSYCFFRFLDESFSKISKQLSMFVTISITRS